MSYHSDLKYRVSTQIANASHESKHIRSYRYKANNQTLLGIALHTLIQQDQWKWVNSLKEKNYQNLTWAEIDKKTR